MRRLAALAALLLPVIAGASYLLLRDDGTSEARAAVEAFAAAWSRGDDARAGALTDAPGAANALRRNRAGLDGAEVAVRTGPLAMEDGRATGRLQIRWRVPAIGAFAYTAPVTATELEDRWVVHYSPQTIHPRLTPATRLGTSATTPERAAILDRDGQALVRGRAVVRVGLERDKVTDVRASATALADALDLDAGTLTKALRGAGPEQFVEALTLREADYAAKESELDGIEGVLAVEATAPLAPTRAFARALLGGVGPATAEQVHESGGRIAPAQPIGQWGLQQAFDERLAGAPERSIVIRDAETGDPVRTLDTFPGREPRPLRTTLSREAQDAAEHALAEVDAEAAIVAVQPSTGDILAVANRPVDSTFNRALAGTYAPGSTFKVITTAALLRGGLDPGQTVACPRTLVVNGKTFKNFEGGEAGAASFADDFAISCNTAFVSLSSGLPAGALSKVANDYGVGRSYDLAVGNARSRVPAGTDAVSRAAAMIGQDRITATPLAMAGVAAAVADGRWRRPRLLADDRSEAGPRLPHVATLRELMRSVVTRGSGTALANVAGTVAGKSGTAEFGDAQPPETHAWFIAYRGDVAIAVLVEKGRSGGSVAAPLAARFFSALG
jgi:cell division protein FtsI/penicillin-binding protein 2